MKKVVFLLVLIFIVALSSISFAKIGDKTGDIYSTDIRAYINGIEVKSYSINGKTCVAVEEVTKAFAYNNDLRTLFIGSFDPQYIIRYSANTSNVKIGKVVGHTYETDIVVYMYDKKIPSYAIDGMTCVCIEDLGDVYNYSAIGGKCTWDPDARTISLEMLYDTQINDILEANKFDLDIKDGIATLKRDYVASVLSVEYSNPEETNVIIPISIYYNNENILIGYILKTPMNVLAYVDDVLSIVDIDTEILYFDRNALQAVAKGTYAALPASTRRDIIDDHIDKLMAEIVERFDTDAYTFLYLKQPTPHGTNNVLLYITADGTVRYVSSELNLAYSSTLNITKVNIDRDLGIVTFTANAKYHFAFNLSTGELIQL